MGYSIIPIDDMDDIRCIDHNTDAVDQSFPLELGFGNPDMYLLYIIDYKILWLSINMEFLD